MLFSKKKKAPKIALLLGGGGARAAYQVGVLKAIAELVPEGEQNPFPIICGTSAGSINAAALASNAMNFHEGVEKIIGVWANFELNHVFQADGKNLSKRIFSWLWSNIGWGSHENGPESLLDNSPLRQLLTHYIQFDRIDEAMESGDLYAYCINACSYSTGESTSFFRGAESIQEWSRTHRSGQREDITVDHLMASSAIPVVFPAIQIKDEYYGDGSMRQITPISPALHLGAEKILIIGLRSEEDPKPEEINEPTSRPTLAQVSGFVMDTLFLNSLYADVERLERINEVLDDVPKEYTEKLKKVDHLIISPSIDVADLALKHYMELPKGFRRALNYLGLREGNSRRFISYLMFIKSFCSELIDAGYEDAMKQKDEIKEFLHISEER